MSIASLLRKLGFCFLICTLSTTAAYAQFSVLYTYGSHSGDPIDPQSSTRIAQGRDGNLYSTALQGGANGAGAAFRITPSGTLTVLYSFCSLSACADGHGPYGGLTLGTDGNFYGTTSGGGNTDNAYGDGIVFKMTSEGALTVLHAFDNPAKSEGYFPYGPPAEGLDGNFYGTTSGGGSSGGCGTIYKVTPSGTFTILYTFPNAATDGCSPRASLVLGTDGDLYGMASYGAYSTFKITPSGKYTQLTPSSALVGGYAPLIQTPNGSFYGTNGGQIFRMLSSGAISILHTSGGTTDPNGSGYNSGVAWASDGNLYGDSTAGGTTTNCSSNLGYCGVIFKVTAGGAYTELFDFENPDGYEGTPVVQHTNGIIYGQTNFGGTNDAGTFWQWSKGLKPFVSFMPFTGHVSDQIQILGQGFTESSVVKFNGVVATHTLTGSTFITAKVPAGTLDGYITVTTGETTLTSLYKFLVHDSWGRGAAMPVAVAGAATGVISSKIYVVSGIATYGAMPVENNQVYNPSTNTWTTAATIPTPVFGPASAVVGGLLYVIGGYEGSSGTPSNLVQIYDPTTNTWTTGAAMTTARGSAAAVVDSTSIYVIGGNGSTLRLNNVEKYVPSTKTWTEEAPLLLGMSEPSAGLLGSTIVAADGYTTSGDLGTTEGYDSSTNSWSAFRSDPSPRNASCFGEISGLLYVAGGINNSVPQQTIRINESFSATTNKWTSLAAMPTAALWQGSAVDNGLLYCFGGEASFQGTTIKDVQIYQP